MVVVVDVVCPGMSRATIQLIIVRGEGVSHFATIVGFVFLPMSVCHFIGGFGRNGKRNLQDAIWLKIGIKSKWQLWTANDRRREDHLGGIEGLSNQFQRVAAWKGEGEDLRSVNELPRSPRGWIRGSNPQGMRSRK